MRARVHNIIFLLLILPVFSVAAQPGAQLTDSLRRLGAVMMGGPTSMARYEASEIFAKTMEGMLRQDCKGKMKFDSINPARVIVSPDKKFRIVTWGIYFPGGKYEYFGLLQILDKGKGCKIIRLTDKSDETEDPALKLLSEKNWYGAIYYNVIATKHEGRTHYILLGWDGHDFITARKIIEVLSFKGDDRVVFGASIFRKYKDKHLRVIFEHSARASFSLRYEKHLLHSVRKTKNGKKDVVKAHTVIIFDRLSPIDPRTSRYAADLEGQYQFYVPETNIFDGFIFLNGKWVFTKDIDARNPKPGRKKKPLPKPEDYFPQ